MNLIDLGWQDSWQEKFSQLADEKLIPARIGGEYRQYYVTYGESGEIIAEVSGRMRHLALGKADLPSVGDWVGIKVSPDKKRGIIVALLPRRSSFSRKAVHSGGMPETGGRTEQQILAANVDTVFLVTGLDRDFNLRRIERYLSIAWDSGAQPVIVLNKADLCDNPDELSAEVAAIALGVPVHPVSAQTKTGLDALGGYFQLGKTGVFLGSSGVGKSSLINCLLGEEKQLVHAVRSDDQRGRHTTTRRELHVLPTGGVVIDTPGLREIGLWIDEEALQRTFADIEKLSEQCHFRDCQHQGQPGCAIETALSDGQLDEKRLLNYRKLQKEMEYLRLRQEKAGLRQAERAWDKKVRQFHQERKKLNQGGGE